MLLKSIRFVKCPQCKSSFTALNNKIAGNNIIEGLLQCKKCNRKYPIEHGLAHLVKFAYSGEKQIADSFGFEWEKHVNKQIEENTVFGKTIDDELSYFFQATNTTAESLKDKVILDAGCGGARLTKFIAGFSPKLVFGIDIHYGLKFAQSAISPSDPCDLIAADIYHPPFANNSFDIVWCNGVIHHTPDPYKAFKSLSLLVKSGGKLYVWVYEKHLSPYMMMRDLLQKIGLSNLPFSALLTVCQSFAFLSVIIHTVYRILISPFTLLFNQNNRIKNSVRIRTYPEFVMTWFDVLSPSYVYRYSRKDIVDWFERNGFENLRFYEDQIGICGIKKQI